MNSKHSYKMAVVGPHGVTSLFKSTGAAVFIAETGESALTVLRNLRKETSNGKTKYAVIFLAEKLRKEMRDDDFSRVSAGVLPAVVVIPGAEGGSGEAHRNLRKLAERAVGMDVLK
ncbi:MAG: V-type ATP synthase subunit F [bacterium]|nr:V-type ATP synthase subunit F [bacterium]